MITPGEEIPLCRLWRFSNFNKKPSPTVSPQPLLHNGQLPGRTAPLKTIVRQLNRWPRRLSHRSRVTLRSSGVLKNLRVAGLSLTRSISCTKVTAKYKPYHPNPTKPQFHNIFPQSHDLNSEVMAFGGYNIAPAHLQKIF